jgi:hypothetical protein
MHSKIEHLNETEKSLVLNAPLFVTALVSGADGEFTNDEIQQAVKIIHIKSFKESKEVSGVYKTIDAQTEDSIQMLISALPESTLERNQMLQNQLSGLNAILPKLEAQFAYDLYNSLKQLAFYVSTASDLGIGLQSQQEKEMAKLSFINAPEQP